MSGPLQNFLANSYFVATAGSNPNRSFAEYNAILGSQAGTFGINQFYTNLGFTIANGGLLGGASFPLQYTNISEAIAGSIGNDIIFAEGGDDIIDGFSGDDYLAGADGNDQVLGNVGNDYLVGRTGNDLLVGGSGTDLLIGGTQADNFGFNSPLEAPDIIADFNWSPVVGFNRQEGDKILVSGVGFGINSNQIDLFSFRSIGNDTFGGLFFGQTLLAAIPLASGFDPRSDVVIV